MKHLNALRIFLLTAILAVAMSAVAFAGAQDFVLVNNTGYDIYLVNVSPNDSNYWEEDILGSSILPNGDSVYVSFGVGSTQYWDLLVTFEDGSTLSWDDIDLLSYGTITLNGNGTASFY